MVLFLGKHRRSTQDNIHYLVSFVISIIALSNRVRRLRTTSVDHYPGLLYILLNPSFQGTLTIQVARRYFAVTPSNADALIDSDRMYDSWVRDHGGDDPDTHSISDYRFYVLRIWLRKLISMFHSPRDIDGPAQ